MIYIGYIIINLVLRPLLGCSHPNIPPLMIHVHLLPPTTSSFHFNTHPRSLLLLLPLSYTLSYSILSSPLLLHPKNYYIIYSYSISSTSLVNLPLSFTLSSSPSTQIWPFYFTACHAPLIPLSLLVPALKLTILRSRSSYTPP